MQAVTSISSSGTSTNMFHPTKPQSCITMGTKPRPLSEATEIFDEDSGDESEFEEYSPKGSFDSFESRRRSQTTLSSYDEASTPRSSQGSRTFDLSIRPVQGPNGPHLFRSSQISAEFDFDFALQMSPMLPKDVPLRTDTAFSQQTVTPVSGQKQEDVSIASILAGAGSQSSRDDLIGKWTNDDVVDWMVSQDIDPFSINCFEAHDINGQVLLNLQFEDLRELDIQSFGKRHELWSAIAKLRGEQRPPSPLSTPFLDISRPCTTNVPPQPESRKGSQDACETPVEYVSSPSSKKRRGRKAPKHLDVITPQESVSIVAIEQLLPKAHKCAKGERCAKWRKQQRQMQQLQDESALGRFPISPTNGGRIYVAGDPGNAALADNIVPNVRKQHTEEVAPPQSAGFPSVVASSDLFGPTQQPEFGLRADALQHLDKWDPQENVKQFLNLQHVTPPPPPATQPAYESPPRSRTAPPAAEKPAFEMFPQQCQPAFPSLQGALPSAASNGKLRGLPKLAIPRSATADPHTNAPRTPQTAVDISRSTTASPSRLHRYATPASEMDVPITAIPITPVGRDASQSVPPSMQYRDQQQLSRSASRATADWRRPSFALPAVKEGEVLSPGKQSRDASRPSLSSRSGSEQSTTTSSSCATLDPSHHSPETKYFGYGESCTHAGWMKKRKNRMLRHEWQDAHFRLKGTQLAMHASARLSAAEVDRINVDDYAVACSNVRSDNKLAAALKSLHIMNDRKSSTDADPAPFAFQLVPAREGAKGEERKHLVSNAKTHHFAVKTKDERIDWMRELMLAKALQQKGRGYDVEVNGIAA